MNKKNISELIKRYHIEGVKSDVHNYLSLIYRWCENNNYKADWKNEIIKKSQN